MADKYLLNRNGRFFARIVIPKDLRPFLDNKTEIRTPLGPDRRTAKARLHTAVSELQAQIAVAERRAMVAKGEAITPGRYPLPVEQIALRNYNQRIAFDTELRNTDNRHAMGLVDDRLRPRNMALSPELKQMMHQTRREALDKALIQQVEERGDFSHAEGYAVDMLALQEDMADLLDSYYGEAEAHRKAEDDLAAFSSLA
ncbi:DUF6538 domain-containing protein [Agrobacterium tumefaciens]|jgi:hypothetical protein|uniref:DUF6538 domain-containing protein n=1 Tax=Agrobacterium tumefaciens TaxID=358 RepID=UPI001571CE35|nr:hypothetical protein [Agrobacterium tumefaciens]